MIHRAGQKFNGFSMKFQKGHKLAKGGARLGAGRKSKQVVADEARATEIAKKVLARSLGPVIEVAKKLCLGIRRKKWYPKDYYDELVKKNPKARRYYYEIEYDSRMIQFWLERFIPAARQAIDVNVDSPEKFWQALEAAERLEQERRQTYETQALPGPIEDDTPPDPDKDKIH